MSPVSCSRIPGLNIEVEGHTDSVGSDEYNQKLSEQRASSVRDYLISQGLRADILTAKGFGETTPVATNDTAAGRQQNRRVELVVSGEVIGTKLSDIRGTTTDHDTPAPPIRPSQLNATRGGRPVRSDRLSYYCICRSAESSASTK